MERNWRLIRCAKIEFLDREDPKFLPDRIHVVMLKKDNYQLDRIIILEKEDINQFENEPLRHTRLSSESKTKAGKGEI